MHIRSVSVLLAVVFLAAPSMADEVYKTVDENGNVVFTDSPPKDKPAEKIELKETNIQPPVEFRSRGRESGEAREEETGPYDPRIVSPGNEYQMGPTETFLNVSVDVSRPLEDEHSFQLFVNGAPHGERTQSSNLTLTDVRRGRKQLAVSIMDAQGSVVATSPPVTVYVIRPNSKPM